MVYPQPLDSFLEDDMNEATSEFQSNITPRVRLIQVHPDPNSTNVQTQSLESYEFE